MLRPLQPNAPAYDIVLLDARLTENDEDGARWRHERDTLPPIVMMTSLTALTVIAMASQADATRYIGKPIQRAELYTILSDVAGRKPGSSPPTFGQAVAVAPPRAVDEQVRILLAEDNRVNQMVAVAVLKKLGYQVDVASNGLEALAALRARPYDLVLMDCQMPEMDGFEATHAIRTAAPEALNPSIPIVALTAHAMKGDRERCLAAGMDDYLAKPLQIDEVAAALRRWLGGGVSG